MKWSAGKALAVCALTALAAAALAQQVTAAATTAPAPTSASPAAAAAHAVPVAPPPQMSPREQMHVLRGACGSDFQKFCPEVQPGGGRAIACLRTHAAQLAPQCQSALSAAAAHN
jgi:hypothetical protein